MEIVNCTPHEIVIFRPDGRLVLSPCGIVPRVEETRTAERVVEGVFLNNLSMGALVDMPSRRESVIYVVSRAVAERCRHRQDIFIPDELVRDETGNVIGCKALARII